MCSALGGCSPVPLLTNILSLATPLSFRLCILSMITERWFQSMHYFGHNKYLTYRSSSQCQGSQVYRCIKYKVHHDVVIICFSLGGSIIFYLWRGGGIFSVILQCGFISLIFPRSGWISSNLNPL